jgi:hypothetical protein
MVSTRLALAMPLVGGWLGAELGRATLGAALRRGRGHGGQPPAQLLSSQLAHHEVTERWENLHLAAADQVADRLSILVLVVDVAVHGLPHGEADDRLIAVAIWTRDHRVPLGLGLLEAEHVGTIGAGGVIGTPHV